MRVCNRHPRNDSPVCKVCKAYRLWRSDAEGRAKAEEKAPTKLPACLETPWKAVVCPMCQRGEYCIDNEAFKVLREAAE